MEPDGELASLDRHVLVVTIWLTAGLIAATLFHYGLGDGGALFLASAFAMAAAAFGGHIIVNAALGADFTIRELTLGLVLYAAALVAFGLTVLFSPEFAARAFLPASLGFLGLAAMFLFSLIVKSGLRPAFEAFDTIRSFRARDMRKDKAGERAGE